MASPIPKLLDELLRDGPVRRAPALSPPARRPLPSGVGALDAALGGGWMRGQLHELVGPPGAGGTALLRAALAAATRAGELCALIDPADAFDPAPADIDLERLLWVRPKDAVTALRAAEIALEARFALVAIDLGDVGCSARWAPPVAGKAGSSGALPAPRLPKGVVQVVRFEVSRKAPRGASPWARLQRRSEKHGGALLLLAREPQAGTFAAAVVELERGRVVWEGRQGAPGRFLRGTMPVGAVTRHKRMPPSAPLLLRLPLR